MVYSVQKKVQQSGIQTEVPKGTVRERNTERNMRRTFKILREV